MNRIIILVILLCCYHLYGQDKILYPKAEQSNQIDTIWGTAVKDPYRWMEDIKSPEVKEWLDAEEKLTKKYSGNTYSLEKYLEYYSSIHFNPLFRKGKYYFSFRHNEFDKTPELYFQKEINDEPEQLFDPNNIDSKSDISIDEIEISHDNSTLSLTLSKNGSDWKFIRFLDMKKEKLLADTVNFVKYSNVTWYKDGIFYYRYDVKSTEESFTGVINNRALYYHKIGTKQKDDNLVYSNISMENEDFEFFPDNNFVIMQHQIYRSEKRYNTVSISNLNDSLKFRFKDIITTAKDSVHFKVLGELNGKLIIESNINAPNGTLYKLNPEYPNRLERFISEFDQQLDYSTIMSNKIICAYSSDSSSSLVIFDSAGNFLHRSKLSNGRTFGEFSGNTTDSILIFSFHSFVVPAIMYTLNINTYKTEPVSITYIHFDYENLLSRKVYYKSKDGTVIPMYLTYKKGMKLNGKNPVILYGYGGFGIKMEPFFNAANVIFVRSGGILAVPCLRGGGDYPGWHEQGMRLKKQNTFDDFIAAGDYLISNKYTSSEKMAAMGGSNGGLLVGAVMLQRPDLFKVVVGIAGVYDMLRYHLFNIGYELRKEYGSIKDSSDFKYLLRYSPVQNIKNGLNYPATLLVAADNDDRVNPFHSFKFLATLQSNAPCQNPYILYYEHKAGHTQSKDFGKRENTDAVIYAFIFKYLGIENKIVYAQQGW